MKRGLKIIGATAAGLVALLALLLVLLTVFDWNRARPWLNDKVSEATGRPFAINGDLSLSWDRPPFEQTGWRRWIPWPHLRAGDVTLGNPEWASTGPTMMSVPQIDFTLDLLPLLGRTISVHTLLLTEPRLMLEQDENGRNNWSFLAREEDEPASRWQFVLHDLIIASGTVRYVDPVKNADVRTRIDTLEDGSVVWKIGGVFNDEKVSGDGKAGALLSLQGRNVKYPVEARLEVGETTITADGTLTDPRELSALDVELKILGASMADLFPLSGVVLPETPKFSTEGRVVGTLARDDFKLRYEDFKGKVGASDISGTLEYMRREPRPILRGAVKSNYMDIRDLRELITGAGEEKQKKDEVQQPPGKVLPVAPFRTERWGKMDAQVEFTGKKIVRINDLPIDNLHTEIRMDNGVLSLAPLDFGVAGGRLTTELRIDGRADPAKARMTISARRLQLRQLFPTIESMQASLGELHGDAELTAAGNSFAALLGSSNGEIKSLVSQGSVSKFVLEAMGLNVGAVIVTKLFGDRQVELNCMAADFGVKDGLMQARTFIVDTEDAIIHVSGAINLDSEKFDLTIRPESKGLRLISLRSPLYIRGTFKNPDVGVDTGVVAAKAGTATVLGVVAAPFAALLALTNPGPEGESPCAILLAEAKEDPEAPPPGKTAKGKGSNKGDDGK